MIVFAVTAVICAHSGVPTKGPIHGQHPILNAQRIPSEPTEDDFFIVDCPAETLLKRSLGIKHARTIRGLSGRLEGNSL